MLYNLIPKLGTFGIATAYRAVRRTAQKAVAIVIIQLVNEPINKLTFI
jgi:hypothetical protein